MLKGLSCAVRRHRVQQGWGQEALARQVGISRQALAAIESGKTTPSTAVALQLAHVLQCRVEDLFSLPPVPLSVVHASDNPCGRSVLGRVGQRWVSHGLSPSSVTAADVLWGKDGEMSILRPLKQLERNALVAGCAPVLGMLCAHGRGTWLPASSGQSLSWLAEGMVHIAGMHLAPHGDPQHHDKLIQQCLPGEAVTVISLVGWRQGLIAAPGNPLGIAHGHDLDRAGLRCVQRSAGAGATKVLHRAVQDAGVHAPLTGPGADSHLDAARAVALGAADVAVVIEPVAQSLGLPFWSLSEERFELALRTETLSHPGVQTVLSHLTGASFLREVRSIGGYDSSLVGRRRVVHA